MKSYKFIRVEETFYEQMMLYYSFLKSYDESTGGHKDERQNKEKRTKKENKKKEESTYLPTAREALSKSFFETPSAEEVQEYLNKKGIESFTGQQFVDHYDSNGWIDRNGNPIRSWKAAANKWTNYDQKIRISPTHKKKHNETINHVTNASQQSGGPSEADLLAAEAQRDDVLDRRLEVVFKGNKRISWLSRNLNAMAKALGVSIAQYDVEMITDDARHLTELWYSSWTGDVFCEAFKWVAQRFNTITKPTVSSKVRELFYLYAVETGRCPNRKSRFARSEK